MKIQSTFATVCFFFRIEESVLTIVHFFSDCDRCDLDCPAGVFFCVISRVFTSDFSVIFSAILLEDKELKQKYWTIMNSWGENFGEKGTMRLLRQDSEDCQIG